MPTLKNTFAGIECINPFWLASAPPTNCGEQIMRAFDAGWGGAVWKTIGEPITNVSSRYSAMDYQGVKMVGFNNIELISDRPIETNLREIAEVKRRYPKHVVIASLMVESKRETWHEMVARAEGAGADGLELNFGCPHGMSERGMGSAVGQVPEYAQQITEWVKERARTPVIVKLTPNITDIRMPARAAKRAGADALSAINTINSITGIDLDTFEPRPMVDGKSSHGGYCGPAVKPIALNMVQQIQGDPLACLPTSGIGGIGTWRDAAEFILLGCGNVQVCTAAMHYGYRIVEDMADGLLQWMASKGFETIEDFRGLSLPNVTEWKRLNLNYRIVAKIHADKCIGCQLCYTACWDGAHQCIHLDRAEGGLQMIETGMDPRYALHEPNPHGMPTPGQVFAESRKKITMTPIPKLDLNGSGMNSSVTPIERIPRVDQDECVGCNLCSLVCPVDGCITMDRVEDGLKAETWEERSAKTTREGGALMDSYSSKAAKYIPADRTRILFIAEAPPESTDRYFYFPDVAKGDFLWIALMKSLYGADWKQTRDERVRKGRWLRKFSDDGYFLIDAVKTPITGDSPIRVKIIKDRASLIVAEVKLINPEAVVLIKTTVYDALYIDLVSAGVKVLNKVALPFPSSGRQLEFASKFRELGLGTN